MMTPNTMPYMIAGYAVILITILGYTSSLFLRTRKLKHYLKDFNAPDEN